MLEFDPAAAQAVASDDLHWMQVALDQARQAAAAAEVPVGAVVVAQGRLLAVGRNETRATQDPTAHAEILALRRAAQATGSWRLAGSTLYVTLEPCAMCGGAIVLARVARLVFAAGDPKSGACGSLRNVVQDPRLNHECDVTRGVLAAEAAALLRHFFAALRVAP